jgi:tRNA pseudouridine32 synthase/23S rRNA pseudouridine746 synthase
MAIAKTPSVITLPDVQPPYPSILDFLVRTFPHVAAEHWASRLRDGRLLDDTGRTITDDTAYRPGRRIFYFREVAREPVVPFAEQILFQNDLLLVADKPHFLPVTPGGDYVEECLLNRLRTDTGIADLAPMHRLDRETAGLVLFSVNPKTRGLYHELFTRSEVEKTYEALAHIGSLPIERQWLVENRLERGEPRFRMKVVPGVVNARSAIQLLEVSGKRARFRLQPITGKTHQLRLHMSGLGFGILNDRLYPELLPESDDDYTRPLQLLAKRLRFRDPVTGIDMEFESPQALRA